MTTLYYNKSDINIYEFQNNNKKQIYNLTIIAIQECLTNNLKELSFLKIMPDNKIYSVSRSRFKYSLNKAILYYEEYEMYEECLKCTNIINEICL